MVPYVEITDPLAAESSYVVLFKGPRNDVRGYIYAEVRACVDQVLYLTLTIYDEKAACDRAGVAGRH